MPLGINGKEHTAPGFRHPTDGAFRLIGCSGSHWSCSAKDTYGISASFGMSWFDTTTSDTRAHGLPLRCLSE
ncbi:hypothetical protein [uncultured Rikenella sp.]|uniref:hypothetical protein n=1 Tax=uncultured Rikenella sp. TaxID=368003 RepID=UPI00262A0E70|nr:hypothetical protein [uncultured Rikenella sp.]